MLKDKEEEEENYLKMFRNENKLNPNDESFLIKYQAHIKKFNLIKNDNGEK